jgi:hypothetical protein
MAVPKSVRARGSRAGVGVSSRKLRRMLSFEDFGIPSIMTWVRCAASQKLKSILV